MGSDEIKVPLNTPRILETLWNVPLIKKSKINPIRVLLLVIQVMNVIGFCARFAVEIAYNTNDADSTPFWRPFVTTYFILQTTPIINLSLHTLLACITGVDKLYIFHLILFPMTSGIWMIRSIVVNLFIIRNFDHPWLLVFQSVDDFLKFFARIFWNIPTRLLYVVKYREIIEHYGAPSSRIFLHLGISFSIIFVIRCVIYFMHLLPNLSSETKLLWFNMWQFGYLAMETSFCACIAIYEMRMYLILTPAKRFCFFLQPWKWNRFEIAYMTMIILLLLLSAMNLFLVFTVGEVNYQKRDYRYWLGQFNWIFIKLIEFLRYVVLWYFAINEWNLENISFCEFENEIGEEFRESTLDFSKLYVENEDHCLEIKSKLRDEPS